MTAQTERGVSSLRTLFNPEGDYFKTHKGRIIDYRTKNRVIEAGAAAPNVIYQVVSGLGGLENVSPTGDISIGRVLRPGVIFGIDGLDGVDGRYASSGVLYTDAKIAKVQVNPSDRGVQFDMLMAHVRDVRERTAANHLLHGVAGNGAQRVAYSLLEFSIPLVDGTANVPLSQTIIAHRANLARQSTNDLLTNWQERGFVQTGKKNVHITDVAKITDYAVGKPVEPEI